ncbi:MULTISPECIES: hydrogenase [Nocardioides]|uniref:Hydrogenase n=1 Tax=Nocardioides vastitatis TaxID=2568655 RepID=A0ABW0ZHR8_9ACTN|nr:hydrogenase [Nocardioides sp.]THI90836.1 hydrogenase [Nocardioides sp.]
MRLDDALLALGVALFFAGLVSGLVIPKLPIPRLGLTSHLEGTQNGMFLILAGLIWGRLELGETWLQIAFWTLLYGTWANWGATLLAGIWGTGKVTPISSGCRTGKPVHEKIVSTMLIGVGITDLIAVTIIFIGLVA